MARDDHPATEEREMRSRKARKLDARIHIACLNVRGLAAAEKIFELVEECKRKNITILGISETKITEEKVFEHQSHTIYCLPTTSRQNGIGYIIKKGITHSHKMISDRVALVNLPELDMNCVLVYGPTNPNSEKDPSLRQAF